MIARLQAHVGGGSPGPNSPARPRALTSAWGPPTSSCQPSAITSPSRTITHPTMGLG